MEIHVVREDESVYSIARDYGVLPEDIILYNGLPEPYLLAVGQTLVILFIDRVHFVTPGESLSTIAAQYSVSVKELRRNNPALGGSTTIYVGERIVISFTNEKAGRIYVNSYAYPFIDMALLKSTVFFLTWIAPFTYGITGEGMLVELRDEEIIATAREAGVGPLMHISTLTEAGSFDSGRAVEVLGDVSKQTVLISEILVTLRDKGYVGVDVDFEYIPAQSGDAYVEFIARLSDTLNPLGYFVLTALAPKESSFQPGLLYEGHKYEGLGAAANAVLLMTYEWGYTYGPPLAVAPIESVRAVLDYAVSVIPPGKILLGIPNYGYDWTLPFVQGESKAESISNQEAVNRAIRYRADIMFDERAQAPYFHYTDAEGRTHEVWFEDGRSMTAKYNLITEYGFMGAGFWNSMRPFMQGWSILNAMFDIAQVI